MTEIVRKATCKCGNVEFELRGECIMNNCCSCNNCVTAAYYVDRLARESQVDNLSYAEPGNPQAGCNVMYPPSKVKLLKGKEFLVCFKLRASSVALRSYTSCCKTVVCAILGEEFKAVKFGIPFNRATISPPLSDKGLFRTSVGEIQRPFEMPVDRIPRYKLVPWGVAVTLARIITFGSGGPSRDVDANAFFHTSATDITEVAGKDAYDACGFTNVSGL